MPLLYSVPQQYLPRKKRQKNPQKKYTTTLLWGFSNKYYDLFCSLSPLPIHITHRSRSPLPPSPFPSSFLFEFFSPTKLSTPSFFPLTTDPMTSLQYHYHTHPRQTPLSSFGRFVSSFGLKDGSSPEHLDEQPDTIPSTPPSEVHIDMHNVDMKDVYRQTYRRPHPSAFATVSGRAAHLPKDTCINLGSDHNRSALIFSPAGSAEGPIEESGLSLEGPEEDGGDMSHFYSIHEVEEVGTRGESPAPSRASVTSTGSVGDVLSYAEGCPSDQRWRAEYLQIVAPILQRAARGYAGRKAVFAQFAKDVQESTEEIILPQQDNLSDLCHESKSVMTEVRFNEANQFIHASRIGERNDNTNTQRPKLKAQRDRMRLDGLPRKPSSMVYGDSVWLSHIKED